MELKEYIHAGILRKGSVSALADEIGIHANSVSDAKAHRRGIPNDAAVKLARLVGANPLDVIAASELATEKKAEKREFWLNFVNPAKTARVAGIVGFLAIVTNFVTTSPAQPALARALALGQFVLCKIRKLFYAKRVFFVSASNCCA